MAAVYSRGTVDKLGHVIKTGRNVGGYLAVGFLGREKVEAIATS